MSSVEKTAMDFWFEFDDLFNFGPHQRPDISDAVNTVLSSGLSDLFKTSQQDGSLNTEFKTKISTPELQDSIKTIADNHLRLLDKFFGNNAGLEQSAFEFFGQGLLFDIGVDPNGQPRRPPGLKMHMMDGGIGGYILWHSFIRAVMMLRVSGNIDRWLQLDRHLALAAAIDSIVNPKQSVDGIDPHINDPRANRIDPTTLSQLQAFWLTKNVDEIDREIIAISPTK